MPAPPRFADVPSLAASDTSADATLRCPGDGMRISHSIHLGRIASHYPPCARCDHGAGGPGVGSRSPALLAASDLFGDEGFEGIVENQITTGMVRKLAMAAGIEIVAQAESSSTQPTSVPTEPAASAKSRPSPATTAERFRTVVVAADGRAVTAELLAAASEGLRRSGCHVVELDPMTAPAVAEAMLAERADGGLFIGNPAGGSHTVGIRVWSRGARPMSSGGSLDILRRRFQGDVVRPTRISGPLERRGDAEARLDRLRGLFHALRPLRFVIDTASKPLANEVSRLLAQTACQVIAPRWLSAASSLIALSSLSAPSSPSAASSSNAGIVPLAPAQTTFDPMTGGSETHHRRLASLGTLTVERQADFGLWIDGDGERLALVDERGRPVLIERLLLALARHAESGAECKISRGDAETRRRALARQVGSGLECKGVRFNGGEPSQQAAQPPDPDANWPIVVEVEFDSRVQAVLEKCGFATREAPARREPFAQAMAAAGAMLGGGPSGRVWFASSAGAPAVPDALQALGRLLQLLSGGDAPLSAVLDAAAMAR